MGCNGTEKGCGSHSPTIFVEIRCEIIVVTSERSIVLASRIAIQRRFILGNLVIPMLEIFIRGKLLRVLVLVHQVQERAIGLSGLAMERLLERGISCEILRLEDDGGGHAGGFAGESWGDC